MIFSQKRFDFHRWADFTSTRIQFKDYSNECTGGTWSLGHFVR